MKKLLILLVLALVTMSAAQATLLTRGGSSFDIGLLTYEPVPAQPGDILDVWVTVENEGSSAAENVYVEIVETHPFTTDSEENRVKRAGVIPSQESYLFKTKVRVASDADIGTNYLHVKVEQGTLMQEADLAITITGETSSLSVERVSITPSIITQGETAALALTVTNTGNTLLRNIQATLDFDDVSVAPVGSSSSKSIDELQGGVGHTFLFNLLADPSAEPGVYKVPLTLTYTNREGTEQEEEESVGIVIGSEPELLVHFDQLDITHTKREGDAIIRVINKGLDEIKLLQLDILEQQGVEVTSETARLYVGNIDEDDYENVQVTLKLDNGTTSVPVTLTYKDSLNRAYTEQLTLPVRTHANGNEEQTNWVGIIVVLVIIGGGVWWYLRRRKRRTQ